MMTTPSHSTAPMGDPNTIIATNSPAGSSDAASTDVSPVGKWGAPILKSRIGRKNPHAPAIKPKGAMPCKSTPEMMKSGQMKCDITTAPPQTIKPRWACEHFGCTRPDRAKNEAQLTAARSPAAMAQQKLGDEGTADEVAHLGRAPEHEHDDRRRYHLAKCRWPVCHDYLNYRAYPGELEQERES